MNAALSTPGRLLITTFGLGHMRPFPGTWGSIPPAVLACILAHVGLGPAGDATAWWTYHAVLAIVCVTFCIICIALGDYAETSFGKKDPGSVVADETAGMCIPLMFIPAHAIDDFPSAWGGPWGGPLVILLAFVLFRIFDIIKPWPCRQIQSVTGGWGILLDDLLAGIYALIGVQLVTRLLL